ncbi:MAG: D-alanine--D-alanine ligase [SAR86 cluster bacterium]|uniref:D-alanine--D-alanine ligase n=1 Tax=SAR86 cluster bacterium TaxID=2030880 RepID=A0A2A4XIC2_9GAMM|nr:MAG: D-alanine--D-alanine ligase [SAR86 cluster bacterium]
MRTINREKIIANCGHVVVLNGGDSAEREISLLSGEAVYQGLLRLGVQASVLDVSDTVIADLESLKPDLALNMLHGQGGEDGTIQGLLEVLKIPYAGSGVLASALAMDKVKSKLIWQRLGLNAADFVMLNEATDWQALIDDFEVVVVKPVSGGSSLGIAIVKDAANLQKQFEMASEFDSEVMAEKCVIGKEFTVGVIEDQLLPTVQMSTSREFYDFDAKYVDEDPEIICPAQLSDEKQIELNELVRAAYTSLGCEGLARVDVMQDQGGAFYLLELNTIPGMTEHSFVPIAANKAGINFDELLLTVLELEQTAN